MTQNRDRKQKIRARMAATGEPYTEAARAISSRPAETGDDFLADRHVDLDAGEFGSAGRRHRSCDSRPPARGGGSGRTRSASWAASAGP